MSKTTYNKYMIILLVIILILLVLDATLLIIYNALFTCQKNEIDGEIKTTVSESIDHNTAIPPANVYSRGLSEEDKYLLAKIVMAEAEGESLECKILVIFVILNRVESLEPYFPDTIKDVMY